MRDNECVFIVNTNGDVYGVARAYEAEFLYGNIFNQPLDEILHSQRRTRSIDEGSVRVERHCSGCKYFGACPGFFAAVATPQQQSMLETSGCPVAGVIDHMVDRIEQTGLKDRLGIHATQRFDVRKAAA